jgi:hypothetical protein
MLSKRQFRESHDWAVQAPGQGPCAQVTAPVLLVAGQEDRLFAGITGNGDAGLAAAEHPYYRRAATFAARVIPRAPHSLALSPSCTQSFAAIAAGISAVLRPRQLVAGGL